MDSVPKEVNNTKFDRWFTVCALLLLAAVAGGTLLRNIHDNSPIQRLSTTLQKSGKFERLDFAWPKDLQLAQLEEASWVGPDKSLVSQIDPHDGLIVLNFWATWCEPCRAELPAMFKMSNQIRGKKVWYIFVSYDESWEAPGALLERVLPSISNHVIMLRDPSANPKEVQPSDSFMNKLGTVKLPETYFIRDGQVLSKIVGAINWKHPDILSYVEMLAKQ